MTEKQLQILRIQAFDLLYAEVEQQVVTLLARNPLADYERTPSHRLREELSCYINQLEVTQSKLEGAALLQKQAKEVVI